MYSYFSNKLYTPVSRPMVFCQPHFYDAQGVDLVPSHMSSKIALLHRCIQDLGDHTDYSINKRVEENVKMFSIYHSNAIEGSNLSLASTVSFLQGEVINDQDSVKDHMDALGHAAAIGLFGSSMNVGHKIDQALICKVNDLLTKHMASISIPMPSAKYQRDNSGSYKIEDNSQQRTDHSESHKFVMPERVPQEMEELFAHCESSNMHPVVKAAVAHYNYTRIHPFQHGNGHGARILMNLILQHYNLPPAIIQVQNKQQYMECLRAADQGDIMPFVSFIASSLIETMEMVLAAYQAEHRAADCFVQ